MTAVEARILNSSHMRVYFIPDTGSMERFPVLPPFSTTPLTGRNSQQPPRLDDLRAVFIPSRLGCDQLFPGQWRSCTLPLAHHATS